MTAFNLFIQTYGLLFLVLFTILVVWSLVWKGIALWKSARNGDKWWFVIMLLVNTAGLLEIIYIYFFSKKQKVGQ